jgi:hypothetical protein
MNPNEHDWAPCPKGRISEAVAVQRTRRQRQTLRGMAGVAVCLVLLTAGGIWAGREESRESVLPAKLTCTEVKERARAFVMDELDEPLRQLIQRHLGRCKHCDEHVADVRRSLERPAGQGEHRPSSGHLTIAFAEPRSPRLGSGR